MGAVIWLVVLGLLVFAYGSIISNANNKINAGVITDKQYYAGGTYYSSDKNGGHMRSDPPQYWFTIRGEKDGETVEYSFEVTETEYNQYKIGDWFER